MDEESTKFGRINILPDDIGSLITLAVKVALFYGDKKNYINKAVMSEERGIGMRKAMIDLDNHGDLAREFTELVNKFIVKEDA